MSRFAGLAMALMLFVAGCGGRRSALLLERYARGPLAEVPAVGKGVSWTVDPVSQTQTEGQVEVTVTHASVKFLAGFFSNRQVFGEFAGHNPYFPEHLVFYVQIANRSSQRIRLAPSEFAMVDDRGNQYSPLNVDYVTAFAEYRAPMATVTRGVLQEASPGYFGFSLPVGKMVAAKPQGRFALIQQSSLQAGYLHAGVTHDGLIAFWSPSREAKTLRLLLGNLKTDFDANDVPRKSLEFPFTFRVSPE